MGLQSLLVIAFCNPKSSPKTHDCDGRTEEWSDISTIEVGLTDTLCRIHARGNTTDHYNPIFATEFNKYDGMCDEISYLEPP